MQVLSTDVHLVIDVQVDFVSGSLAVPEAKSIIAPINHAAKLFEHVIVVTDWHPPGHVSFASAHPGAKEGDMLQLPYGEQGVYADHCVQGTAGAELDPDLQLTKAELIFRKGFRPDVDSYGAFYANDRITPNGLGAYLRGRGFERVFCAGLARYVCVMQTALGAARDGFSTVILRDASAGDRDVAANDRIIAEAGIRWMDSRDLSAG